MTQIRNDLFKVASRKHSIFTHFPKDQIATSASEPRFRGLLAEGELEIQYLDFDYS